MQVAPGRRHEPGAKRLDAAAGVRPGLCLLEPDERLGGRATREEPGAFENEDLPERGMPGTFLEPRDGLREGLGPVRIVAVGECEALPGGNRKEELEGPSRHPVVREDGLQVALRALRVASPDGQGGPLSEGGEVAISLAERGEKDEGLLE